MSIKASACAALIVAAGIMSCLWSPLRAQESTGQTQTTANSAQPVALGKPVALNKYSKHRSRHSRRHARKSSRTARNDASRSKSAESRSSESKSTKAAEQNKSTDKSADTKASENRTADSKPAKNNEPPPALPSSVANARAEMLSPAASTTSNEPTAAATRAAPQAPAAASAVVPSDQLNDVDRSLTETRSPPAATIALASLSTPLPTATASKDDSTWANTSLIGKIFIAFGGLLTLASAARMMIA